MVSMVPMISISVMIETIEKSWSFVSERNLKREDEDAKNVQKKKTISVWHS